MTCNSCRLGQFKEELGRCLLGYLSIYQLRVYMYLQIYLRSLCAATTVDGRRRLRV